MRIHTIEFDIHNFETNVSEHFIIEDTDENYEFVMSHRYTRDIHFSKMFDFQFEKDECLPIELISLETWVRMLDKLPMMDEMVMEPIAA